MKKSKHILLLINNVYLNFSGIIRPGKLKMRQNFDFSHVKIFSASQCKCKRTIQNDIIIRTHKLSLLHSSYARRSEIRMALFRTLRYKDSHRLSVMQHSFKNRNCIICSRFAVNTQYSAILIMKSTLFVFSNYLSQGSSVKNFSTRILYYETTNRVFHYFFRCKKNSRNWNGTKSNNSSLTTSTTEQKASANIICIRCRSIVS